MITICPVCRHWIPDHDQECGISKARDLCIDPTAGTQPKETMQLKSDVVKYLSEAAEALECIEGSGFDSDLTATIQVSCNDKLIAEITYDLNYGGADIRLIDP